LARAWTTYAPNGGIQKRGKKEREREKGERREEGEASLRDYNK